MNLEDLSTLSQSEIEESYKILLLDCKKQKQIIDQYRQKIYSLEQEKRIGENVLQDELQFTKDNFTADIKNIELKLNTEIKNLQNQNAELKLIIERLGQENAHVRDELKQQQKIVPNTDHKLDIKNNIFISKDRLENLEKLECKHSSLIDELESLKQSNSSLTSKLMETEIKFKNISEYYQCSKENLKCKMTELDEAKNIIESLQEEIVNMGNELASYKCGTTIDHNKKGNSLFAEVDDQRQEMRDLLQRQKQQYYMMNQKYKESCDEIRRLKQENAEIHNEVRECAIMFKNADKVQKSKLNEHVGFLKTENMRLTDKLKQAQQDMDSFAKTHGVNWLSSMLKYCENETKELNQKLISYGMKKCEAECLCAEAQEIATKWRFEALKSRFVIMNREMLLKINNIQFDPKIQDVRQTISNLFSANEQPLINDFFSSTTINLNNERSDAETSILQSNINNSNKSQNDSICANDNTSFEIVSLPNSNRALQIQSKKRSFDKKDEQAENILKFTTNMNDENYKNESILPNLQDEIPTKHENLNQNTEKNFKDEETIIQHIPKPHLVTNSNRVKQVSVEMVTINLKRKEFPKDKSE